MQPISSQGRATSIIQNSSDVAPEHIKHKSSETNNTMNKKTYILFTIICCVYGCGGGGGAASVAGASINSDTGTSTSSIERNAGSGGDTTTTNSGSNPGSGSGTVEEGGSGAATTPSATTGTASDPGTVGEGGSGKKLNTENLDLPCSNAESQNASPPPSSDTVTTTSEVAITGSNEAVGVISSVNPGWIEVNGVKFLTTSVVVLNGFNTIAGSNQLKVGMNVKVTSAVTTIINTRNAVKIALLPSVRGRVRSFNGSTMTLDIANKQVSITQQTRCETNDPTIKITMGEFVEIYGYEIQSTNKTSATLVSKISEGPTIYNPYEILGKLTGVNVTNKVASIGGLSFSYTLVSSTAQNAAVDGAWTRIASEMSSEQSNPWIIKKMAKQNTILTISGP